MLIEKCQNIEKGHMAEFWRYDEKVWTILWNSQTFIKWLKNKIAENG